VRIFSGIQPTGQKTFGNYSGGFRQYAATQEQGEAFFCIVDLHSITIDYDPAELRESTLDLAAKLPAVATVNLGGGFKVGRMPGEKSADMTDVGKHVEQELLAFREREVERQEGRGAAAIQVLQQLMDMQCHELLFRHCRLISIQAVDSHDLGIVPVDATPDMMREFSGGELGGIELFDDELVCVPHRLQINADPLGPREQKTQLLIKDKHCGFLATFHRRR